MEMELSWLIVVLFFDKSSGRADAYLRQSGQK
jgi:hypothetical protein